MSENGPMFICECTGIENCMRELPEDEYRELSRMKPTPIGSGFFVCHKFCPSVTEDSIIVAETAHCVLVDERS
jgi:hypothetical protein